MKVAGILKFSRISCKMAPVRGCEMADYAQRDLLTAPDSLVTGGKFNFGTFKTQFRNVNPLEAKKPLGFWMPRAFLNFRLKEWQAFQLGNERWFILVVLYNAKISALTQFIAYDRETRTRYHFEKMLPSWIVKVPASIWDSDQNYRDKHNFIQIVSQLGKGRFYINAKIGHARRLPDIEAHFETFHEEGLVEPIVVSIPLGENRAIYSHKCLMPMQGSMSIGNEKVTFLKGKSFALIDDHKGYYPYVMKYDWVTAAAYDDEKRLIGFNLTDNQSVDSARYNENCLWVNGKLNLLPPVKFTRPYGAMGDWKIKDEYGMVDLLFKPVSMGEINMNLLFLKVKYRGPFGYCNGFIKDASGNRIDVNGYFGMGEEKYVRG
jgi:hypothetical protein